MKGHILDLFDELGTMESDSYGFFVKLETLILEVKLDNDIEVAVQPDSKPGSLDAARQYYNEGEFMQCVLELRRLRSAFLSRNKDFTKMRHKQVGPC
ncbi:MAG: hypothetical protein M1388_04135 [Thaumarchaeota archaeon]|nr:hypothetical protein [Nitrososphaerota archaeon]